MKKLFSILVCIALFSCSKPYLSDFNKNLKSEKWSACWIAPKAGMKEYGVYHFRKTFLLNDTPAHFIIHVSADNRYKLYVNGQQAAYGPASGDMQHWQFETLDIAQYLQKDSNTIAALVWNSGDHKPWVQITLQTAFILQGNTATEEIINTNATWKVYDSKAYSPCIPSIYEFAFGQGTGAYDRVGLAAIPWGWNQNGYNDANWQNAVELAKGSMLPDDSLWAMVQRQVPMQDYIPERFKSIVSCEGAEFRNMISGSNPLTIPAHSKVSILIDKGIVTTAFPELLISGGKGSKIRIVYNECMYKDTTRVKGANSYKKGDRSATKGMYMLGLFDEIVADGGTNRSFIPLNYRTYRFVQLNITTEDEPLVIEDYKDNFTAYPFERKATFTCSDTVLNKLFDMGWRSVRLCSHDSYKDCPYYEQLQYFGDLNVTSRVSAYLSGDFRLVKQALLHGQYSMKGGDILQAAYPANGDNIIPSFSISWIDILDFYAASTGDTAFINEMMPSITRVMDWYKAKLDTTSWLLGPMPYWNFIDCNKQWPWKGSIDGSCEPPGTKEGKSSILTMQYLYGLQKVAMLCENMGLGTKADHYRQLEIKVTNALKSLCWDEKRSLYADIPSKTSFSQHANYMALVTGVVAEDKADALIKHTLEDKDLVQASLQFKAYLHMGLRKYGKIDNYTEMLDPWRQLAGMGLTTFPEYPTEDNRSETHAWTTFPVLEMITVICGIQPAGYGSATVIIEPHLGNLEWAEGSLPHPNGSVKVKIIKAGGGISATVTLPEGVQGSFKFKNKSVQLHSGQQQISL